MHCWLAFMLQLYGGVGAHIAYFAKELVVHHHAGTTRAMVLHGNKSTVTKLLGPSRKTIGQNMGMNID